MIFRRLHSVSVVSLLTLSACAAPVQSVTEVSVPPAGAEPANSSAHIKADIVFVKAVETSNGVWRFDVSVAHKDTGWDNYADGWDVVAEDGHVIKPRGGAFTRTLVHPHVGQIPFTRSQNGIEIDGTSVTVRAHVLNRGYGGQTAQVDLTKAKGPYFSVKAQP